MAALCQLLTLFSPNWPPCHYYMCFQLCSTTLLAGWKILLHLDTGLFYYISKGSSRVVGKVCCRWQPIQCNLLFNCKPEQFLANYRQQDFLLQPNPQLHHFSRSNSTVWCRRNCQGSISNTKQNPFFKSSFKRLWEASRKCSILYGTAACQIGWGGVDTYCAEPKACHPRSSATGKTSTLPPRFTLQWRLENSVQN